VSQAGTYLATFRAVAKKHPHKPVREILDDLVNISPGEEGKWFAAAKQAGLHDDALALASRTPCDPKTLARSARLCGQAARVRGRRWSSVPVLACAGYGYEITGADVWEAYRATLAAAERQDRVAEVKDRVCKLIAPG
jgi:hypothetical protein